MRAPIEASYNDLVITQDLGLGMMLWLGHFFLEEDWARLQHARCRQTLDRVSIEPEGYFCREPGLENVTFAFSNYGYPSNSRR